MDTTETLIEYTAGFLFTHSYTRCALIRKTKPSWQSGLLNAIGGKVNVGETAHQAHVREFREETGVLIPQWTEFCVLTHPSRKGRVHFFTATADPWVFRELKSTTAETVVVLPVAVLHTANYRRQVIPNLQWLIPMAIYGQGATAEVFDPEKAIDPTTVEWNEVPYECYTGTDSVTVTQGIVRVLDEPGPLLKTHRSVTRRPSGEVTLHGGSLIDFAGRP